MKPSRKAPVPGPVLLLSSALASLLLLGCALDPRRTLLPNQEPEVAIEKPSFMDAGDNLTVGMRWKGTDADGKVDHYLFASNPRSVDRVDEAWTRTRDVTTTLGIQRRAAPGRPVVPGAPGEKPHVFVVRAVDDAGAMSAPATMAFFGANIAPDVFISSPQPNLAFIPTTPTSLTIRWEGIDFDGQITGFKYRLFTSNNPDFPNIPNFIEFAFNNPQAALELYAPDFAGWDAVGAEVNSVQYSGLTNNEFYMFLIVAFDDAGDHSAVLSPFANMLRFVVSSSQALNPVLCVSSSFLSYCMQAGGRDSVTTELPADTPIPVSWSGQAPPGTTINAYRWVLDPKDPADEKPRTHPTADPNHWTPWNLQTTSTTIGPFSRKSSTEGHALYIQARDEFDRVSTLRIDFTVVPAQRVREILVVDDTRLMTDQVVGGVLQPPRGEWPTAAELDTFLYARGGFPWRGYPAGTLSSPGLLDGYDFDTLGTRGLAGGVVPLEVLGRYRQVIWMVDATAATFNENPASQLSPVTSLRLMNSPSGATNTLAAYVAQGGKLWLCGGGAASATLYPWQKRNTPPDEWTNADGELVAGRFMYDFAHWRSALATKPAGYGIFNHSSLVGPGSAPGRGWSGQPNYDKLLAAAPQLLERSPSTDPVPPLRFHTSYYITYFIAEYLFRPNQIIEDVDPRPNHEELQSALDTIYVAAGQTTPFGSPVMTYYHGQAGGSVVFSGFPIWHFQRVHCQTLTDFVLQDIWGLTRRTTALASRR